MLSRLGAKPLLRRQGRVQGASRVCSLAGTRPVFLRQRPFTQRKFEGAENLPVPALDGHFYDERRFRQLHLRLLSIAGSIHHGRRNCSDKP